MSNILVPIDGSDSAKRAVEAAIKASRVLGNGTLHLVTVRPPILSGNVTRFVSAETINEYYQEEGRKALESSEALVKAAGVPYQTHILVGPVAQTLADFAKQNQCEQIVMGTRGLGSVTGLVLGSVATKILTLVDVPVTLVR